MCTWRRSIWRAQAQQQREAGSRVNISSGRNCAVALNCQLESWRSIEELLSPISSFQRPTSCFVITFCCTPTNICIVQEIFVSIKQIFVFKEIYLCFLWEVLSAISSSERPTPCFVITFSTPPVPSLCLQLPQIFIHSTQAPFHCIGLEKLPTICINIGNMRQNLKRLIPHKSLTALDSMHILRCEKLWHIWAHICHKDRWPWPCPYIKVHGPETTIKIWDPWTRWWSQLLLPWTWEYNWTGKTKIRVRRQIGRQICGFFCHV